MIANRFAVGDWAWAALAVTIALALAVDLFAHRGVSTVETRRRSAVWAAMWISIAIAFGVGVTLVFGSQAGAEFATAYLIEKSLSVDNLCVFLLVFSRLGIPREEQRRVLFWGILGALVTRGAFIAAGASLIARWHFVLYGFGALLVFTGVRLFSTAPRDDEPRVVGWLRRRLPITQSPAAHRFLVVEGGKRRATLLLVALIAIELTDVMFAIDSIPAAFSVTRSTFILYSSNVLAVLGLRALFVVVADALDHLRYLRFGVAAVLVFSGAKMLANGWVHVPAGISLAVIVVLVTASIFASLLRPTLRSRQPRHP